MAENALPTTAPEAGPTTTPEAVLATAKTMLERGLVGMDHRQ